MSEPKIFYPNMAEYIGSPAYSDFGIDRTLLVDRRIDLKSYTTSGDNDNSEMILSMNAANPFSCTDVFILNHNIKHNSANSLKITDDGSGSSFPGALTNITKTEFTDPAGRSHTFFKFDQITVDSIAMLAKETEIADQQKGIAEIIVTRQRVNLTDDFSSYDKRYREKIKEITLGDGSVHKVVVFAVNGRNMRYEANCQFKFVSEATVEAMFQLKDSGDTFLFQPESLTRPQDVFLCHWAGSWDVKYSSSYKGAGYTVNMQVKEV